jgi:sulfur carrier protein
VNVLVNGRSIDLDEGATVADLVERVAPQRSGRGLAVAINGEVVARTEWDEASLSPDDQVEVLTAIGGG